MNTNDFDPGIARDFEENESYYLIGFEPTNAAADGKLRQAPGEGQPAGRRRPHAQQLLRAGSAESRTRNPTRMRSRRKPLRLQKAMGGILPMAGMPMRASVAPFAVPGQRLSTVAIVLGITQPIPAAAANGRVTETTELLTSAFTPEGDRERRAETHGERRAARRLERRGSLRSAGADRSAARPLSAAPGRAQRHQRA